MVTNADEVTKGLVDMRRGTQGKDSSNMKKKRSTEAIKLGCEAGVGKRDAPGKYFLLAKEEEDAEAAWFSGGLWEPRL